MKILVSAPLNFIDKNYHQKAINRILISLNLKKVIDIGAHKGEFLENIISINKKMKVYSFEPQSKIFTNLQNSFITKKNIFIYNLAISNVNKKQKLNINIKTSTSTFSNYNESSYWKKIKDFLIAGLNKSSIVNSELVQSITLDKFCKKNNIKKIDLLKIDTEGHEFEVLSGATNLLKKDINHQSYLVIVSKIFKIKIKI